jgi:ADP-ribose pyrophosphatase
MSTSWTSLGQRELLRVGKRFIAFAEHVRLPDGREVEDYLQFRTPDFVVMVAVTEDGRIICERQYKHGPRRCILSLPAGAIEEGEDPLAAAQRELLEETGYASDEWQFLSSRVLQANAGCCWTKAFLARNCRKVTEPNSGDLEDMTIELKSPQEILNAVSADEMPLVSDVAALLPGLMALGFLKTA